VTRSRRPVLIINPRSGGGKASAQDLLGACRVRGIKSVVFQPGDDLAALALAEVTGGADALGMAGGDGSQAAVAAVAAAHDIAFVCIAAGTRNHFAFDVGVDRSDLLGGLDAFIDGVEHRIDLGRVNGRTFVNNVALGVYGTVVQSTAYRDAKLKTVMEMLPDFVGPAAEPFDLRFVDGDGRRHDTASLLLVSNNPYLVVAPSHQRSGTRGTLDTGVLGVVALTGPPPHGLQTWTAPAFRVDSAERVPVGIDGESVQMEPPLLFESLPRALTVRTSKGPSALSEDHR
jgi:diacylglycerol kinase family enzyme